MSSRTATAVVVSLRDAQLQMLETRIRKGDLDALLARWEFGRQLREERGEAGRLPNGRVEELSNALDISRSEVNNRMRFAKRYPTAANAAAAFRTYGSWYAICREGLNPREATDLIEWGVLAAADLAGLSDDEVTMVVREVWAFYDDYCRDPDRDKDPIADGTAEIATNPTGVQWFAQQAIDHWRKLKRAAAQKRHAARTAAYDPVKAREAQKAEDRLHRVSATMFRRWIRCGPFRGAGAPSAARGAARKPDWEPEGVDASGPVAAPITPVDTYHALLQRVIRETRTLLTAPHGLLEERVRLSEEQAAALRTLLRRVREALGALEGQIPPECTPPPAVAAKEAS